MAEKLSIKTAEIMLDRFGKDMPISLATVADGEPQVRIVDGYYEDGAFYVITYALSDKMRQLEKHPARLCAVSGSRGMAWGKISGISWM